MKVITIDDSTCDFFKQITESRLDSRFKKLDGIIQFEGGLKSELIDLQTKRETIEAEIEELKNTLTQLEEK